MDASALQTHASSARAHGQPTWCFEWITSWDDVWAPDFQLRWEEMLQMCPDSHIFFHPVLVRAWLETCAPLFPIEPRFLLARCDQMTLLFPLVLVRNGWKDMWRRLIAPVGFFGFDYHDPLWTGEGSVTVWSSFWMAFEDELLRRWGGGFDQCMLHGIRNGCEPEDLHWSTQHDVEVVRKDAECQDVAPYADISRYRSIDDFMRSRSANLRGDVGRRVRRLQEAGQLTYHVYAPHEHHSARRSLDHLLRSSYRRYQGTWRLRSYHDNLLTHVLPTGMMHLSETRLDRTAVAWDLGFIYRDRFYWYMTSFNEDFAEYAPGKVHVRMCIADAIERGLAVFDFLPGNEAYKFMWSDSHTDLFGLLWTDHGLTSRARVAWTARVKPGLVSLKRRVRDAREALVT